MVKMLKYYFFILLIFISFLGYSRDTPGCALASDNSKVTTSLIDLSALGIDIAFGGNYAAIPPNGCVVLKSPLTPCKICPGVLCLSTSSLRDGYLATIIVNCNLDNHDYALVLGFAGLGFIFIKRKNIF